MRASFCILVKNLHMKLLTLGLCMVAFSSHCNSQKFFGKDAFLYLNTTVKPITKPDYLIDKNYHNFFLYFDTITKTLADKKTFGASMDFKPFQVKTNYIHDGTDYEKLKIFDFLVTKVYIEKSEEKYPNPRYYILELRNETIGTIYYKYNTSSEPDLEIKILYGLEYPENYWCQKFMTFTDKFNSNKISISEDFSGISIIYNQNSKKYSLSGELIGYSLNVGGKGFYLLLEDGTKIAKPEARVDVEASDNGHWKYTCTINLNNSDLQLLRSKKITDFRLYVHDKSLDENDSEIIMEILKCF